MLQARHAALHCLLRLLQTRSLPSFAEKDTAPTAGFLAHLLLRTAEAEVARGLQGSKAIRLAALEVLLLLITVLGKQQGGPTLAFLLPGLIGGLGKQLLAAGMP